MNTKKYYNGIELNEYELKENRISYRTLAKCFDAVLCNNIVQDESLYDNIISGSINTLYLNGEEITQEEYEALDEETQEQVNEEYKDIFQYYIVSDNALYYLKEAEEIVLYSDTLDVYVWCVTHYGTSWDYVSTNIMVDK